MKTSTNLRLVALLSLIIIVFMMKAVAGLPSGVKQGKPSGIRKVTTNNVYHPMDINSVFNYYGNNGDGSFNPFSTDAEGFEFNKGTGGEVIFEDGIVWGCFQNGTLKVGGSTYNHGLQAGKILSPGNADDPGLAKYRLFRVRPDINPSTPFSSVQDILNGDEVPYISRYEPVSAQDLYNQYIADWNEWPAADGAPYTDVNNDGVYDPTIDIPGITGADQTMWFVANDLDGSATFNLYGSAPIGLEEQRTIWAYKAGPGTEYLGYTIFSSTKLINKSGTTLDSMFISQWSDPDLGGSKGFNDDYVGCDTSRDLGFVYNGQPLDGFFGKLVPSGGYVLLQGPTVPGTPTDSALADGKFRHGVVPLRMSAFNFFVNGNATYTDPQLNNPAGTQQWYNLMNGLVGPSGAPYTDPITGLTTKFLLYGDPVTGQGWLDGSLAPPGDRRMCLIAGPFTMAPGDTQQIYVANTAALCGDRVSSVDKIKYYSDLLKGLYKTAFIKPPIPQQPKVIASNLNGEVILNWQDSLSNAQIESYNVNGFKFQGYNVYQLPTNTPDLSVAKRIATFDVKDLVTRIEDVVFDKTLCAAIKEPVQSGGDFGVQHYIDLTSDVFSTYGASLVNGEVYYFAVTAYAYNSSPGLVGNFLESQVKVIVDTVHSTNLGVRLSSVLGDTITTVHSAGFASGTAVASVVDATRVTNHDYEIDVTVTDSVFNTSAGVLFPNPKWHVRDVTLGKDVTNPTTWYGPAFASNDTATIVDGVQVGVYAAPFWVAGKELGSQTYTPSDNFNWSGINNGLSFFDGGLDVASNFIGSELNPWQISTDVEVIFDSANGQNAYDFHRTTGGGSAGAPYSGFYPQPFRVYNITDPANPKQIDFVFMERDGQPTEDNVWAPGGDPSGANREYFWFIDTAYSSTAKSVFTGGTLAATLSQLPAVWAGWYYLTDPSQPAYHNGDVWQIHAAKVVTPNDKWTFNTARKAQKFTKAQQLSDVSLINVYPNPYFGFNKAETDKYHRFVRISHLPEKATIRVYNLAGILVRTIMKDDPSQFAQWDLANETGIPAAAGIYVIFIDMPGIGATKELKLAIIPGAQFLDRF